MAANGTDRPFSRSTPTQRRPWVAPSVEQMPRLTELTLATGQSPINGDCPVGGGSTCF